MSRGAQKFRQSDVVRAVKAVRSTGEPIARVEISKEGNIVVVIGKPDLATPALPDRELEKWIKHHEDED